MKKYENNAHALDREGCRKVLTEPDGREVLPANSEYVIDSAFPPESTRAESSLAFVPLRVSDPVRDGVTEALDQDPPTETLGFQQTEAALTDDSDAHQTSLSSRSILATLSAWPRCWLPSIHRASLPQLAS
jgi:hypothetical protein